jgi:hypothetical protein
VAVLQLKRRGCLRPENLDIRQQVLFRFISLMTATLKPWSDISIHSKKFAMIYSQLATGKNLIRLLTLDPVLSSREGCIKCSFSTVALDDEIQYEALSYVWGDVTNKRTIEIDGHAVAITANLHSALKHLQLDSQERTIWVDAICIDQSNEKEKQQQVSRMNRIYEKASRVVVWLGEGWKGSDLAMEFLSKLGTDASLHLDPSLSPSISVQGKNLGSQDLCKHLIRLFDLPWWKRTWTVQEFVLAEDLVFQCSRSLVTGTEMYMARENFWCHRDRCCPDAERGYADPQLRLNLGQAFVVPARLDIMLDWIL